jgi:PAS domain-containing protein
MSNVPSDTLLPFRRKPARTSIEVGAANNGAGVNVDLRDEEQAFVLPAQLFEQLPFAVYVCDAEGLVRRYNRRAAELWGRSPKPLARALDPRYGEGGGRAKRRRIIVGSDPHYAADAEPLFG